MEQFQQQMLDRQLQTLKLTPAEEAAVRKAIPQKREATRKLGEELTKLRNAADKEGAPEAELRVALDLYQKALAQYRQQVAATDAELTKALSLRAKARLTALGVLDNGVGGMGGMGAMMGMGGGMGGFRRGTGGMPGMPGAPGAPGLPGMLPPPAPGTPLPPAAAAPVG